MKNALDDLLGKVNAIAKSPRGDLLRQVVELMYERLEAELDTVPIDGHQNPVNFKDLFFKMEATLRKESSLSEENFEKSWGLFKTCNYKSDDDYEIYWKLVKVVFYSGMNAGVVTSKLPILKKYFYDYRKVNNYHREEINKIIEDQNIIRNKAKIEACVNNAKIFNDILIEYGTFANYLESFGNLNNENTLEILKKDLKRFKFLGPITAYHFMLDLGLKVWKPDRVIRRIIKRLGLINNSEDIGQAITVGREIADQVGLPIRYIDVVFVKYGQIGEDKDFGLTTGICLEKNPRCSICGIKNYCNYKNLYGHLLPKTEN